MSMVTLAIARLRIDYHQIRGYIICTYLIILMAIGAQTPLDGAMTPKRFTVHWKREEDGFNSRQAIVALATLSRRFPACVRKELERFYLVPEGGGGVFPRRSR
jgi:hypothetical protein